MQTCVSSQAIFPGSSRGERKGLSSLSKDDLVFFMAYWYYVLLVWYPLGGFNPLYMDKSSSEVYLVKPGLYFSRLSSG